MEAAEAEARAASSAIAEQFGAVDAAVAETGQAAVAAAGEFSAAGMEIQAALDAPLAGMEIVRAAAAEMAVPWTEAAAAISAAMLEMGISAEEAASVVVAASETGAAAMDAEAAAGAAAAETVASAWTMAKSAMMGLFMGAMVIGGISMLTEKAGAYEDQMARLSTAFGITVQEAGRLDAEAQVVGASTQTVTMAMTRLTKASGDAGSASADMMKKWGIGIEAFRAAKLPEQLQMLADAYAGAGDRGEQFISDVLGPRGAKLAPLIADYTRLQDLTAGMDFPNVSPEDADAMDKFRIDMHHVVIEIETKLMPAIIHFKGAIVVLMGVWALWKVGNVLFTLAKGFGGAIAAAWRFVPALIAVATGEETEATAAGAAATSTYAFGVALKAALPWIALAAVAIGELTVLYRAMTSAAAAESEELAARVREAASNVVLGLARGYNGMMAFRNGMNMLVQRGFSMDQAFKIMQGTMQDRLVPLLLNGTIGVEEFRTGMETAGFTTEEINAILADNADALAALAEGADGASRSLRDLKTALVDAGTPLSGMVSQYQKGTLSLADFKKQLRDAGASADQVALAVHHAGEVIRVFGHMTMTEFKTWRDNVVGNMRDMTTNLDAFTADWKKTPKEFAKINEQMNAASKQMLYDMNVLNSLGVPKNFEAWIADYPGYMDAFVHASAGEQTQWIHDFQARRDNVKSFADAMPTAEEKATQGLKDMNTAAQAVDDTMASILAHANQLAEVPIAPPGGPGAGPGAGAGPGTQGAGPHGVRPVKGGAWGGSIDVASPTAFMAGELGSLERVTITPLGGTPAGPGGGGTLHVRSFRIENWKEGIASMEAELSDEIDGALAHRDSMKRMR